MLRRYARPFVSSLAGALALIGISRRSPKFTLDDLKVAVPAAAVGAVVGVIVAKAIKA